MAKKQPVTKKAPAKKAAAKKTAKKAVKKATISKKAAPKKTAKKKSNNPLTSGLLDGQTVSLAGRFNYFPAKGQLEAFVKQQGGKLTEKIDDSLDMLIVGEGKKSRKEKDVEKLNQSGAGIRIVDDVTDLTAGIEPHIQSMLTDPKQVEDVAAMVSLNWLFKNQTFDVTAETFTKAKFGTASSSIVKFDKVLFKNTRFEQCSFRDIQFDDGWHDAGIEKCVFDSCKFDRFDMSARDVTIQNCTGSELKLNRKGEIGVDGSNFKKLQLNKQYASKGNINFTNTKIGLLYFYVGFHFDSLSQLNLTNVTVKDMQLFGKSMLIKQSSFSDSSLSISAPNSKMIFNNTKFLNVDFSNMKLAEMHFQNCELINCNFAKCQIDTFVLGDSKVSSCTAKGFKCSTSVVNQKQQSEITGYDFSKSLIDLAKYTQIKKLVETIKNSNSLSFQVEGNYNTNDLVALSVDQNYSLDLKYSAQKNKKHELEENIHTNSTSVSEMVLKLLGFFRSAGFDELLPTTLKTKTSGCKLKPKELKTLIIAAAYEAIDKEAISEQELKEAEKVSKAKAKDTREAVVAELKSGQVNKVNKRTLAELKSCSPFRKIDLSSGKLKNAKISELVFEECDFSSADFSGASLKGTNFRKSNLSGANLAGTDLAKSKFRNANLTGADLSKTKLAGTDFAGANLAKVNFSGANFNLIKDGYYEVGVDLRGVDLSTANLKGARMKGVRYDDKTKLPKSVAKTQLKQMSWEGGGVPPHERKQNKKVDGPIDFEKFMERVHEITDASRLQKSMKMLKADSFELFSDIKDDKVVGVVKSQSDADLVYSCTLDSQGNFACCTQNLNPCGGLRGAICKHILVLVLGLTKSGQLDAGQVDGWINDSKLKSPELDKDEMSEVLLKYKGAEAGEIDWRPTETVPEDFFAF